MSPKSAEAVDIFTIAIIGICVLTSISILTDYLRYIGRYQWERRRMKWFGGMALLFMTISLAICFASRLYHFFHPSTILSLLFAEIRCILHVIGECLAYLVFILRIHYTFQGDHQFQVRALIIRLLLSAVAVLFVFQIPYIVCVAIYYSADSLSANTFDIIRIAQLSFNNAMDLIIAVLLLSVFISKLRQITLRIQCSLNPVLSGKGHRHQNDTILLNITTKLAVLTILPLLITETNLIYEMVMAMVHRGDSIWLLSPVTVYMDLADTMCCIWCCYMSYSVENALLWYGRCCKIPDRKCKGIAQRGGLTLRQTTESYTYFELTDTDSRVWSPRSTEVSPVELYS